MTLDAWWTLAVIVIVIATLASERLSASMTLLGATVVLLVTGVLTPAQAFSGFSNSAPITVAALYVVARAIERTGVVQPFTLRVLGDGTRPRRSLLRLVVPTIGLSAFVNNTPIVALMAPPVNDWAHKHGLSPSRFLMPLSYATILGGVITTVGTSTNLVVSGLLEADG